MDRLANARIGAAAADVGHRLVNLCVAWAARFFDERDSGHDLSGLAISTLWYLRGDPCLLHGMQRSVGGFEAFNRGNRFACDVADGDAARTGGFAINMDGARAARRDAATEFCARQTKLFANNP